MVKLTHSSTEDRTANRGSWDTKANPYLSATNLRPVGKGSGEMTGCFGVEGEKQGYRLLPRHEDQV